MKKNRFSLSKAIVVVLCFCCSLLISQSNTWIPIGPAPINGGPSFFGNVSGRATVIEANPNRPEQIWLGTANGGVWHSLNGAAPGMNWNPMTPYAPSLAIGSIFLNDCNETRCNQVFIGTGENNLRRDTYYGRGIYVLNYDFSCEFDCDFAYDISTLGNTAEELKYGSIYNLIRRGEFLYFSVAQGVTSTAAQATVPAPEPPAGFGIFRIGVDGTNLMKLGASTQPTAIPSDLELSGNELIAAFFEAGIYKYEIGGSGAWEAANVGLPDFGTTLFDHIEVEVFEANEDIMYAALGRCPSQTIASCVPSLYKTINGGMDWTLLTAGGLGASYTRYTHALAIHPTNSDIVFYGGTALNKSVSGGMSFSEVGADIHSDIQDVTFPDPGDPDKMYVASDGGFNYNFELGEGCWASGNYDLQITQFYSLAADEIEEEGTPTTGMVMGGTQDNNTVFFGGSRVWGRTLCSDGGDVVIENPGSFYGAKIRADWNFQLDRTFSPYFGFNGPFSIDGNFFSSQVSSGIVSSEPSANNPPIVQHPDSKHLYFGTNKVYRKDASSSIWMPISQNLDDSGVEIFPFLELPNVITAIAVSASDENRSYAGMYNGDIWKSIPGTTNWEKINNSNVTSVIGNINSISSLAVDPENPEIIYATYSGFSIASGNYVWQSNNGGDSWNPLSSGLPSDVPVNVIKIDAANSNLLWLGTDQGLYKKEPGSPNWEHIGVVDGLTNAPVFDIATDPLTGRVYSATHGNGVFMLTPNPLVNVYEGWVGSNIWDVLITGNGFDGIPSGTSCTVRLITKSGAECAIGTTDGIGANIMVNADGELITDRGVEWEGRRVIPACLNGDCVGGFNISGCNSSADPVATVQVTCGGISTFASISEDCPQQSNPPSSIVSITPPLDEILFMAEESTCGISGSGGLSTRAYTSSGTFTVFVTLALTSLDNGGDRIICAADISYNAGETHAQVMNKIKDAINNSRDCAAQHVSATLFNDFAGIDESSELEGEDVIGHWPFVSIKIPAIEGGQIIPAIRTMPGGATSTCFSLEELGLPALNQLAIMETTILASETGAMGGEISLIELSTYGSCRKTINTFPGQTPEEIANNIAQAFQNVTPPGTFDCEARQNPYDVNAVGNKLITVTANHLTICTTDPGIGFTVGPEGLDLEAYEVDFPQVIIKNFPNPTSGMNTLIYELEEPADIVIELFNALGQKIRTLDSGRKRAGVNEIVWDVRDPCLAAGVYFIRTKINDRTQGLKVVVH